MIIGLRSSKLNELRALVYNKGALYRLNLDLSNLNQYEFPLQYIKHENNTFENQMQIRYNNIKKEVYLFFSTPPPPMMDRGTCGVSMISIDNRGKWF